MTDPSKLADVRYLVSDKGAVELLEKHRGRIDNGQPHLLCLNDLKRLIGDVISAALRQSAPEARLLDPNAIHISMLAGTVAKPSVAQIIHVYGRDALLAELNASAPGWRPISEHKPDGNKYDLWHKSGERYANMICDTRAGVWRDQRAYCYCQDEFTHYRAIPAPPADGEQQ